MKTTLIAAAILVATIVGIGFAEGDPKQKADDVNTLRERVRTLEQTVDKLQKDMTQLRQLIASGQIRQLPPQGPAANPYYAPTIPIQKTR